MPRTCKPRGSTTLAVSVPLLLLLAALAPPTCQGHAAALPLASILLKENIRLLSELLETEVSCDRMNVTNIFAGTQTEDDMGILCKATTVVWEGRSCHQQLEGVYLNLLDLVRRKSTTHKAPCPVAAGNATSLRQFLRDLHRVLRRLLKGQA